MERWRCWLGVALLAALCLGSSEAWEGWSRSGAMPEEEEEEEGMQHHHYQLLRGLKHGDQKPPPPPPEPQQDAPDVVPADDDEDEDDGDHDEQPEQPQQDHYEPGWMTPEAPNIPQSRWVTSRVFCGVELLWHVDNHPFGHPEGSFPWGRLHLWLILDQNGTTLSPTIALPQEKATTPDWANNGTDRLWMEYGRDRIYESPQMCAGLTHFVGFKLTFLPLDQKPSFIHFIGLGLKAYTTSRQTLLLGAIHRTVTAGSNLTCVLPPRALAHGVPSEGSFGVDCF